MTKQQILKNINKAHYLLNNGYIIIQGQGENPYLYNKITACGKFIHYSSYGQFASKNNRLDLKYNIENYYTDTQNYYIVDEEKFYKYCIKFTEAQNKCYTL